MIIYRVITQIIVGQIALNAEHLFMEMPLWVLAGRFKDHD